MECSICGIKISGCGCCGNKFSKKDEVFCGNRIGEEHLCVTCSYEEGEVV
jgi:hypothetical protein